jgi:hypothetical protein
MDETKAERRRRLDRERRQNNPEKFRQKDRDHWQRMTPEAREERRRKRRERYDAAKIKDYLLRQTYGISASEYEARVKAQGGVCAICRRAERGVDKRLGTSRKLAVDHCHKTGIVWGLLCRGCNQGLGQFGDDPTQLRAALRYLEDNNVVPIESRSTSTD